ncbi:CsbD family protein [Parasporobacterium paucivorans]|uniref:CsbD-like n=1 Tax=Parasporobacterium paucivorans DSM 15970 TaxID=1122934 RepID=A0A1M6HCP3_9FIRM|nr:CsbD family protein [Parasporobacterium paucivorans]SHJ19952.1 CsbD-like [Parasporobacterium paucivorans DSM 15970]
MADSKEKIIGEVKEAVGKVTGNEELELKGKIQSSKSDLKEKVGDIKEGIAEKINDIIDKKKDNK